VNRWALVCALAGCSASAPVVHGPSLTTITPDAVAKVDAWAEAIGGRDAIRRFDQFHITARFDKGGLSGTLESWATASGAFRIETTLGVLHEVHVFDGSRGWLVDPNREVRDLDGPELDDALDDSYIASYAALLLERRAGAIAAGADGSVSVTPAGSHRPLTVTFDPATHLPLGFHHREAEKQRTTAWSDWRVVGGVKMPFSIREDNGNPNDTTTITIQRVDRATAPAFTRPVDAPGDSTLASEHATIPIDTAIGSLVFAEVAVNGHPPMRFIVDSGAESTVLNASRLPGLGLTPTGKFATGAGGGDVELSYVAGVTLTLAGATLKNQIVAAVPLDQLEPMLGQKIDGILGYDFLSRFVVELDWRHNTMKLYDRDRYKHTASGERIAITLGGSTPQADAAIAVPGREPIHGMFTIDTGCACSVQMSSPFVDANKLLEAVPEAKVAGFGAGAGGMTHDLTAEIPSLALGKLVIPKPHAEFSRDTVGASADPESAGLIGSVVFRDFLLVLDYRHKQLWLDPLPE